MPTLTQYEDAFLAATEAGDDEAAASLYQAVKQKRIEVATTSENPFDDISDWDEFTYGWDRGSNDIGNWYTWLESRMPTVVGIDKDTYSDEFLSASPDQRLAMLNQEKEGKLQQEYPELYALSAQGKESGWTTTGDIAKSLATPTTLAPLGGVKYGVKGAVALGSLLSTQYTLSDQLASGRDINAGELGVSAAIGGVASGGFYKVAQKLGERSARKVVNAANDNVDKMNYAAAEAVRDGVPAEEVGDAVRKTLNITKDDAAANIEVAEYKFKVPETAEEAKILLEATDDITSSASRYKKGGWAADAFSTISDRVGYINKGLKKNLREFDMKTQIAKHQKLQEAQPFLVAVNRLPKAEKKAVSMHLSNGDYDAVEGILGRFGNITPKRSKVSYTPKEAVDNMRNMLSKTADELDGQGLTVNRVEDYFPRVVKDYDGLREAMGKPARGRFDLQLAKAARALKVSVDDLTDAQREDVINATISGRGVSGAGAGKLKFNKQRTVDNVTDELDEFYKSPEEALEEYVVRSVDAIGESNFFGKSRKLSKDGKGLDYEGSIGAAVDDLMKAGDMPIGAQTELEGLLKARFEAPKLTPNKFFQRFRTGNYAFTIGNPFSALNQIQDLGLSTVTQGLMPTISSIFGKKVFKLEDFGLDNFIINELSTVGDYSKGLNKILAASGFKRMDQFGKEVLMNAAFKNGRKMAKKDSKLLRTKYGEAFGDEYPALIKELSEGKVTERTKMYIFSELADAQPLNMSEVPLNYAKMANGRLLYMLKTFGIRQLGLMRNNTIELWKEGHKVKAMQNALLFSTIPPLIGATAAETQDFILGEGFDVNDIPDQMASKLVAMGMASRYDLSNITSGRVSDTLANLVAPPVVTYEVAVKDIANVFEYAFNGTEPDQQLLENTASKAPLVGKFLENFFYGGLEKRLAQTNKEDFYGK